MALRHKPRRNSAKQAGQQERPRLIPVESDALVLHLEVLVRLRAATRPQCGVVGLDLALALALALVLDRVHDVPHPPAVVDVPEPRLAGRVDRYVRADLRASSYPRRRLLDDVDLAPAAVRAARARELRRLAAAAPRDLVLLPLPCVPP